MHEKWSDRFWEQVGKEGPVVRPELGPCWLWTGSRLPSGYGRFGPAWRVGMYAHRVSWEMANGREIPAGFHVLHRCDNPPCVRPQHLLVGTRSDNMRDMHEKGRAALIRLPGEAHPSHKLTAAQVATIRARWAAGGVRQRDLAAEFGVSRGLIGHIVRGIAWRQA